MSLFDAFNIFSPDDMPDEAAYAIYAVALIGGGMAAGPAGIAAASSVIGLAEGQRQGAKQNKIQVQMQKAQEIARQDEIRSEIETARQRTNLALSGAGARPVAPQQASFAAQSFLGGGLPSLQENNSPNNGSAGTF